MKNETKTPATTGQDILEALENGWEITPFFDRVLTLDAKKVYTRSGHQYSISCCERFLFVQGGDMLSWPEYYAKHCLSRPFVPEEWGWEESESGKWLLHGSRGRGYCIRHSIIANEIYFLTQDTDVIEITIPTARDYITLAEMLGIETTKTEKS